MKTRKFLLEYDTAETILIVLYLALMIAFKKKPQQMPLPWMAVCTVAAIYLVIPMIKEFIACLCQGLSWKLIKIICFVLPTIAFIVVFFIRTFNHFVI